MNLINDKWIPIRRLHGRRERIAPWQLSDQHETDPIVALDAPRPDFNGALMQFLIGLLQVAAPPTADDDGDWIDWLEAPPSPDLLRERFSPFEGAFNLAGDGSKFKFMQDCDELEVKSQEPVSALLIDSPGANGIKNNADHFIKRGRVSCLCPACVATALFTLQTNAPSGGAGHRTSLRGGGPLTTLVVFDPQGESLEPSLWRDLWLNVLNRSSYSALTGNVELTNDSDIFPWLASTRVSDKKGEDTYAENTHPLQMYWGMPRRIRLDWDDVAQGQCDLCGQESEQLIQHYATKNYGVNYNGVWQHPLSPHRVDKKTGELIPLHPQTGGFSYRHWLVWADGDEQNRAALVVRAFADSHRKEKQAQLRLAIFGYDMDNMKARCWYESTVPLYTVSDDYREIFSQRVDALVKSATEFSGFVRSCVKEAWFKRPGDAKGDTTFISDSFFSHTEEDFYAAVHQLRDQLEGGADGIAILNDWHTILRKAVIDLFDHWVAQESLENANPRRIAIAHQKLISLIHSKKIKDTLFLNNRERAA
ncbi:MAG: type I-E CRISPR-associated protein Cse1/CasA [Gammaproteobacteria bacterium]|nr:type I-E CRISPR-associated protein Cse1/CasA [Gammaproteobacteria bacterium]